MRNYARGAIVEITRWNDNDAYLPISIINTAQNKNVKNIYLETNSAFV